MEAKAKHECLTWWIEVSGNEWVSFGEFLHCVFDEFFNNIIGNFSYPRVICDPAHKDEYVRAEYDQATIEIASKGYDIHFPSLLVQDHNGNIRTASIGIETVEHQNAGRRVREFRILGVEFWEAAYITTILPNSL